MTHTWTCPLCEEVDGKIERQTRLALEVAMATHIMNHENSAGLRAVDRARLGCTDTTCSLGKGRAYDSSAQSFVPKLTDYDKKFLSGCKIKID